MPAAAAEALDPPPQDLPAASWVLVDAGMGDVLAARDPRSPRPIASATKLMTAYLALRELRPGRTVTAPRYRAGPLESLMGLRAGERIKVRDLLYGLLLASGNDAAAALAEAVSGSEDAFVRRMNSTARRLGLEATSYGDPAGLDPASAASAADLVRLTLRLREQRLFRRIVDTPRKRLGSGRIPRAVVNRNELVHRVAWVSGVKTGRTLEAGYVLVSSGERNGADLVAAVLGAPSEAARDSASLALLEYGVAQYRQRRPIASGEVLARVAIAFRDGELPLTAKEAVRLDARRDQRLTTDVHVPEEAEGPIARGERLGTAIVLLDGERIAAVPLVAARAVAAPTALERVDAALPGGRALVWVAAGLGLLVLALLARAVVNLLRPR